MMGRVRYRLSDIVGFEEEHKDFQDSRRHARMLGWTR
jgi:hypothetical protein